MAADKQNIFECRMCGDCCKGFGGTYVGQEDIAAIAAYLNEPAQGFRDHYCVPSGSRYVLAQKPDGYCVFYRDKCGIHPVKPAMCRRWPYLPSILVDPANWDAMAQSCPGMRTGFSPEIVKAIVAEKIGLQ